MDKLINEEEKLYH